jgi:hypothetical protein
MTVWYKIGGEWTEVQKPYIKRLGIQRPARKVLVKRSGVWEEAYEHDTTPPQVPLLTLQIVDNRWIKVGARTLGANNDPDLKRIRILVSREAPLGTQFGTGFIATNDDQYPKEPWSDWFYNAQGPGGSGRDDSSVETYKQYPPNANSSTDLPGGKTYYFAAWSEDRNGNWSVANQSQIRMPEKDPDSTRGIIKREARFQALTAGVRNSPSGTIFTPGQIEVRDSPAQNGYFYYGNLIGNAVGERGTPTILSAKIRLTRADDSGLATANVYLFWHEESSSSTTIADTNRNGITNVGTINKGESKWFDVPSSYYSNFNTQLKGFGLAWGIQASDYLVSPDLGIDSRNGEVNVVWEEEL